MLLLVVSAAAVTAAEHCVKRERGGDGVGNGQSPRVRGHRFAIKAYPI